QRRRLTGARDAGQRWPPASATLAFLRLEVALGPVGRFSQLRAEEYEAAKQRDPIKRVIAYLESLGLWDEQRERELTELARQEVERALEAAQAFPGVTPQQVFDDVYG